MAQGTTPIRSRLRTMVLSALLVLLAGGVSAEFFGYLYLHHVVRQDWTPAWMGWYGTHRRVGTWHVPNEIWGGWRQPNAVARHENACFDYELRSNSAGARDRERSLDGSGRIIMLGDSFAEGFGVANAERASDVLEQRLGREVLNFAIASQGPLQYRLIYEHLARRYEHDHVLVMLYAGNDFTDNDWAFWRSRANRDAPMRPYYERTGGMDFRIIQPIGQADLERRRPAYRGFWDSLWSVIRTNSWAVHTVEHVSRMWTDGPGFAGYYDVTDAQIDGVIWSLAGLRQLAGERKVTVALLPSPRDFARAAQAGAPNLPDRLRARLQPLGIGLVDLMAPLRAAAPDIDSLYIRCDGHWTALGNKAAAEALAASGALAPQGPAR